MNISKIRRKKMIDYLNKLKQIHNDDENNKIINEIELSLTEKKYGLVWEEHSEKVNTMLENNIPIFTEEDQKKINNHINEKYNFILEGDNLHSLHLLEKTHEESVDVIYIDPPYNTNNSLTYDDTRVSKEDSYLHSKWLSFMKVRLEKAKTLLKKDGIIFLSIDDNEGYQLKLLCDEIFGESNFMGSFSIIKAEGGGMAKYIIKGHDLLLIYAKDLSVRFPLAKPKDIRGKIIEIEGVEYWIQEDSYRKEFGTYGNLHYEEILQYKDQKFKDDIDLKIKNNECILIPKDNGMNIIGKLRRIDEDYSKFHSVLKHLNKDGVNELRRMGLSEKFDYPKPTSLIQELIEAATFKFQENYLILDFFAGSGTTGEAVIKANEKDGKNRNFILCTNNEVSAYATVQFLKKLGYLLDYKPNKNKTSNSIFKDIEKELSNHNQSLELLIKQNKNLYDSYGIAQSVTFQRMKMLSEGYLAKDSNDEILFERKITVSNLKDSEKLFKDVEKIKEKNNHSEFKLKIKDSKLQLIGKIEENDYVKGTPFNLKYFKTKFIKKFINEDDILSTKLLSYVRELVELENMCEIDDVDRKIILNKNELKQWQHHGIKKGMTIYLPTYLLLSREIENIIEKNDIHLIYIPDYYFYNELMEVNEL